MRFRILCTMALGLAFADLAGAGVFTVKPGGDSKVVFASHAPIEAFEGKTDRLTGSIRVDPGAVGDSVTAHFEVELASLDTGKRKRNEHMRNNHLETTKFPLAVFDGATILSPAGAMLAPGKTVAFELEGTFTLHGVSRRMRCSAEATFVSSAAGGRLVFMAAFPVTLADYSIKRPEFLFMKLAETQQVRVSATASSQP